MLKFFGKLLNKTEKAPKIPYILEGQTTAVIVKESALVRNVFIKHMNSKGPGNPLVALTVGDIKKGYVVDFDGYQNEIVLFLRKNKQDR